MKILTSIVASLLLTVSVSQAAVVKKSDDSKNCTLYSLKHAKSSGDKLDLADGESIHLKGSIYGFTLREPKVDFDNREVSARVEVLKYGLNKDLKKKVILKEGKVDINKALLQVNRKVLTMDSVCINREGELIYFSLPN
jgi:hypothetical protein